MANGYPNICHQAVIFLAYANKHMKRQNYPCHFFFLLPCELKFMALDTNLSSLNYVCVVAAPPCSCRSPLATCVPSLHPVEAHHTPTRVSLLQVCAWWPVPPRTAPPHAPEQHLVHSDTLNDGECGEPQPGIRSGNARSYVSCRCDHMFDVEHCSLLGEIVLVMR
jgi:hypothetical protein